MEGTIGVMAIQARQETQISIFLENRAGVVSDLADSLAEHEVNIKAITVLDTHDVGTMRMVVEDHDKAINVLKEYGAAYMEIPVLTIEMKNEPGGFARIARTLADAGVKIEYVYGTATPGTERTVAVFRVNNVDRALGLTFD